MSIVLVARAYREAADQRGHAEAHLKLAREVIDEALLERAGELKSQPQMTRTERRLLQKAAGFYERISQLHSSDPDVLLDSSEALLKLARLYTALGRLDGANDACRHALSIAEGLVERHPDVPSYRRALAEAHLRLANVLYGTGIHRDGLAEFGRSLAEMNYLCDRFPDRADFQHERAKYLIDAAVLHSQLRTGKANRYYHECIELLRGLVATYPDRDEYCSGLTRALLNYAVFLGEERDGRA